MFRKKRASGFTLIELLAMIAVIGILIALLLPAIQSARETARRLACQNQLKQLSFGCLSHESSIHFFPTGGWDGSWVGDPECGFGKTQPGGWAFNILPYIEQKSIYSSFRGLKGNTKDPAVEQLVTASIAVFNCPTRRLPVPYPWKRETESSPIKFGAKSDYAINMGSDVSPPGQEGDPPDLSTMNGISYQYSTVKVKEITSGTSRTYLVGEKYMDPTMYTSLLGENVLYAGCDQWNFRIGMNPPYRDRQGFQIFSGSGTVQAYESTNWGFGSAHPAAWNMSFCDGSVQSISYDIDPIIHKCRSNSRNKIPF